MNTETALSPIEVRLIAALTDNPSANQADLAARIRVSERHVRRLLGRESVRAALDTAARDGIREAASLLGRGAARAARALIGMADGTLPTTGARVAACRAVLEAVIALNEFATLEARIADLEHAWRAAVPGAFAGRAS
jgi:hypothetical protein